MSARISQMIKMLKGVQDSLDDYPDFSRPLRNAADTLQAINNANPGRREGPFNTRIDMCKSEVEGVCGNIRNFKDPKDKEDRARKESTLKNNVQEMIRSIIKLAEAGATTAQVHAQIQELQRALGEQSNGFSHSGSGAQNNNTGSGKQYNNNNNSGGTYYNGDGHQPTENP